MFIYFLQEKQYFICIGSQDGCEFLNHFEVQKCINQVNQRVVDENDSEFHINYHSRMNLTLPYS